MQGKEGTRMAGRLKIFIAGAVCAVAAVAAPAANAGLLVNSAQSCDTQQYSQPFSRWGDSATYTPVPGGGFEPDQSSWTLSGGAKIIAGNEPFKVGSTADSRSLYMPQGGVATSPAMCVGLQEPTIRWFQKQSNSLLGLTGVMAVTVLTETSLGVVVETPVGVGLLGTSWSPSLTGVILTNLLPLLPGNKTAVAFRFRAITGSWNVDDVYVDPYQRR
jgi:hypothetical protein